MPDRPTTVDQIFTILAELPTPTQLMSTPLTNPRRRNNHITTAIQAMRQDAGPKQKLDFDLINEPTAPTIMTAMDNRATQGRFR